MTRVPNPSAPIPRSGAPALRSTFFTAFRSGASARRRRPALRLLAPLALFLLSVAPAAPPAPPRPALPPIVFVSRTPASGGAIPGVGPRHRADANGGRLMVRDPGGRVRPLLGDGRFFDAADPSVSWDGRWIAFAATVARDSAWRIYKVRANGGALTALTRTDRTLDLSPLGPAAARFGRYDDFDPCWLPDGRVCFASTRFPQASEVAGIASSNLFAVNADGTGLARITAERNGAEEPAIDPRSGRIVYARWWLNRYLASERDPLGATTDRALAVPADSTDLWQAVSIEPDGNGIKLAGGHPRVRAELAAYQPLVLADGTLLGVRGDLLEPGAGGKHLSLECFPGGFAAPRHLAGALAGGAGSACAPAVLPDGRIVFSYDPSGKGDLALYTTTPRGGAPRRLLDLPGTLELDAAPLTARRRPPVLSAGHPPIAETLPAFRTDQLGAAGRSFRFDCLNVFAMPPVDSPFPDGVPVQHGAKIRFYAVLARPEAVGGDSLVLVRESGIDLTGGVHEHDMPADTPMFEQLVDSRGRVLRSASGPAHVPGFNSGRSGGGTQCMGCHLGHSAIPVAKNYTSGETFNCSPSAEVTASSVAEGTAGARAAVDRRARGPADKVAWVAESPRGEWIRLAWSWPIDVSAMVLYPIGARASEGSDLRLLETEVVFFRNGKEVGKKLIRNEISRSGTRLECSWLRIDAVEIRPSRVTGRVRRVPAAALAEIETLARLAPLD